MTSPPEPPRLLLLNGMPGAGKSTLARRLVAESPGTLLVDPDLLRAWIGAGPQDAPDDRAEPARYLALAMAAAHLGAGHDVVVAQLVARVDQVERFARVADDAAARLVHVVLRPTGQVPEARVPDAAVPHLLTYAEGLAAVCARTPVRVLAVPDGDVEAVRPALAALLARRPARDR